MNQKQLHKQTQNTILENRSTFEWILITYKHGFYLSREPYIKQWIHFLSRFEEGMAKSYKWSLDLVSCPEFISQVEKKNKHFILIMKNFGWPVTEHKKCIILNVFFHFSLLRKNVVGKFACRFLNSTLKDSNLSPDPTNLSYFYDKRLFLPL